MNKRILSAAVLALSLVPVPSHAAKREPCRPIDDGKGGKVWARPVKGGFSTLSCEATVTLHHTDRVKVPTVKHVSPTSCTVWLPDTIGKAGEVVVVAHQACIDAMHHAAEVEAKAQGVK